MSEVLQTVRRVVEAIPAPPPDVERIRRAVRRRARRRRITTGGVALVVAAAGLALVAGAFREAGPQPGTPASEGPLDPTTLTYDWSVEIENASAVGENASAVGEVLQDPDRIYVPTTTGAVAYPKACSDPCQPVWTLDVVETSPDMGQSTALTLEDGLLAVSAGGRLAVVATDCGNGGASCRPLWYADPLAGSSGYVGPLISNGVVRVMANEGDAPENIQTAVAFDVHCREDGGECPPIWQAEVGSGAAYIPGAAVGDVFYQQVGTTMFGFPARCRTDGGACEPDFVVEATGDPQTQASSLYGPVLHDGTLVLASGDGSIYGYPEHCGTSCQPLWVAPIANYLESYPKVAGDVAVVSHDGGVTAVPLSCGGEASDGECAPTWHASLDGYWSVGYADENIVLIADHLKGPARIAVLPTSCTGPCQPMWTAEMGDELYGVASDGASVFASDGRRVLAYPAVCSDPCEPTWTTDLDGAAWNFLIDDRNLVVTGRLGSDGIIGIGVTVFAGEPRAPSEEPIEEANYEIRNVVLSDVVTGEDGAASAIVSYEIEWSDDQWPGYVQCRVEILDADGNRIGGLDFETASLQPDPPPDMIDVPLSSGVPATAAMSCGDAHRPSTSAAYVISNAVVVGTARDPRLVFDVSWATDEPPLYQACEAELQLSDGTIGSYPFGLSVPPGRGEVLLTPEFAGARVLDASCHPRRGQADEAPMASDVASVDPMPAVVVLNASTDLMPELERRVRDWATNVDAAGMSDQEIADTMDALTLAIANLDETEDEWLRTRELMMRLRYLCELLPTGHPYRGGEYCA